MGPMTREMFYYFNLMGWCYWVCDDRFTVKIAEEEYVIQRLGLRYWRCVNAGSSTVFRSQHDLIAWLGSRR